MPVLSGHKALTITTVNFSRKKYRRVSIVTHLDLPDDPASKTAKQEYRVMLLIEYQALFIQFNPLIFACSLTFPLSAVLMV